MFYNGGESGLVTLAGKGRTCTITNHIPRVVHQGVGGGLKIQCFEKIYVAETGWTEDNVMKREH
jgi:hypothetical protein